MPETIVVLLMTQLFAMMSPGPDMFLIMKNGLGQSKSYPVFFTILGIAAGLSIHIGASIAGIGVLLNESELLFKSVRYLGAAYLLYLGLRSLLSHSRLETTFGVASGELQASKAFREGFFTNLLNPKVTLFILSLFTQFIQPDVPTNEKLVYGMVLVLEAILVWSLFARGIRLKVIRRTLADYALWIDRTFGLLLVLIAVSVFWND